MTIGKHRPARRIDAAPAQNFAVADVGEGSLLVAPPPAPVIPAPTGLALSALLGMSAVTPTAKISASWSNLEAYDLETYQLQLSTDAGFADVSTQIFGTAPNQNATTIDGLRISTTYYGRVRAVVGQTPSDWSASASVTTPADTTAPGAPSSHAAQMINGGDLVVTWSNPASSNFRDVEIKIYESASKVTLYGTFYDATQRFSWPVRANLQATSGAGDPALYVELRARSWGAVFSAAVNASASKSAPSAPTVTLAGGVSLLVATVTSARESVYSQFEYVWKRDAVTVATVLSPSTEQQYAPGATADEGVHSWTVSVRERDAFGQYSTATTPTAVVLDVLSIDYLRAGAFYRDSVGNTYTPPASGTLAALKDDNRTSGGVSYAA